MSTSQRHIIGRIVLELETAETDDTWTLQSALSELLQQSGSVEIEQLFNQRVSTSEVIRLEQIVVELPPFSSQEIIERFMPQLLTALSSALDDQLGNTITGASSIDTNSDEFGRALKRKDIDSEEQSLAAINETLPQLLHDRSSPNADVANLDSVGLSERNQVSRNIQRSEWESFLYFLTYGRAPWWQEVLPFSVWVERWEELMQVDAIAWRQPLRQCLASSTQARTRLINQFPTSFCQQLVIQLQPAWIMWPRLLDGVNSLMQRINTQSATVLFSTSTLQYLEQQAWLAMLAEVSPDLATNAPFPISTWLDTWLAVLIEVLQTNSQFFSGWVVDSAKSDGFAAVKLSSVDEKRLFVAFVLRDAIAASIQAETSTWLTTVDLISSRMQSTDVSFSVDDYHQLRGPSSPALLPRGEGSQSRIFSEGERAVNDRRLVDNISEGFSDDDRDSLQVQQPNSTVDAQNFAIANTDTQASSSLQPQNLESENTVGNSLPNTFESDEIISETQFDVADSDSLSSAPTSGEIISETLPGVTDSESANLYTDSLNPPHLLTNNPPKRSNLPTLSPDEQANGIYLSQAGLVILHPFLKIYFEDVGLLTNDEFSNEYVQQQAIALLHYLSTGQTNPSEYELVLPKLLCNWPLNEPVNTSIVLSPNALTEAENLLNAVINYWDALKSTTIDGLREGFLQRPGKLTYSDGWKLQIEQQAIDILLSRLPWGLGMVKLPWMTDVLVVEWA